MSLQTVTKSDIGAEISKKEWQARIDLAASYRMIAHNCGDDLTYNHLSARVPDEPNHLLIKPHSMMFSEITASNLLKYDMDGNPLTEGASPLIGGGLVIHAGVLSARPDINAVFHTHTTAVVGVSSQKQGLLPINQSAMKFHGRLAYHEFQGFEFDPKMCAPLLHDLGEYNVMILRNHGCLVTANSVGRSYILHHFLEMACQGQLAAMTGGAEINMPSQEVLEFALSQQDNRDQAKVLAKDWPAVLRFAERTFPGFNQ